jgi:hypothetical protein
MRRLILSSGLLAAVLMAAPQPALTQQADQPVGGGGGVQRDPGTGGTTGTGTPSTRPSDQPIGGGGDMRRGGTEPGPGGQPSMRPSDQPPAGGGGQQRPGPADPPR